MKERFPASSNNQTSDDSSEELEPLNAKPTEVDTNDVKPSETSSEGDRLDLNELSNRSYQALAGSLSAPIPGEKYVCPHPKCSSQPWFRRGLRTPPICEEHGVVFVPAPGQDE